LIDLEHEGLVIRERNRGAMVVNSSAEDLEEVWSLRVALEGLALKYAIERATAEDVANLAGIVQEITTASKGEFPLEKAVDLDLKFHEQLVAMSKMKRLISFWQGLRSQIWFLIFSLNLKELATLAKRTDMAHRQLLDCVRDKDCARGLEVLKRHMEGAYTEIVKGYRASVGK